MCFFLFKVAASPHPPREGCGSAQKLEARKRSLSRKSCSQKELLLLSPPNATSADVWPNRRPYRGFCAPTAIPQLQGPQVPASLQPERQRSTSHSCSRTSSSRCCATDRTAIAAWRSATGDQAPRHVPRPLAYRRFAFQRVAPRPEPRHRHVTAVPQPPASTAPYLASISISLLKYSNLYARVSFTSASPSLERS